MYHELLIRAIERGQTQFDFGRSSVGSGTYNFKRSWGAEPIDSSWFYYDRKNAVGTVRPDHPGHQWKIAIWKRLPVWLTRRIGPAVVRGIP